MSKPDPKPKQRRKADFDEWTLIRHLKLGPCRVCRRNPYGINLHHLLARSLGGDDLQDNMVPLCGSGTMGCHGAVESHSQTACELLRASLSVKEIAYVKRKKGAAWLERRYPRKKSAEDVQATESEEPFAA